MTSKTLSGVSRLSVALQVDRMFQREFRSGVQNGRFTGAQKGSREISEGSKGFTCFEGLMGISNPAVL